MGTDYVPKFGEAAVNAMERTAFDAMDPRDKTEFFKRGGRVYTNATDDEKAKQEREQEAKMVSPASGKSLTRREWDAMTNDERSAFVKGR